jgi:hypothetical protein
LLLYTTNNLVRDQLVLYLAELHRLHVSFVVLFDLILSELNTVSLQLDSVKKLMDLNFNWILPGMLASLCIPRVIIKKVYKNYKGLEKQIQ